jgi:hypothetical protein
MMNPVGLPEVSGAKERVKLKLYQPFARMLGASKVYFEDIFPQEMTVKIADIPDENLITPPLVSLYRRFRASATPLKNQV